MTGVVEGRKLTGSSEICPDNKFHIPLFLFPTPESYGIRALGWFGSAFWEDSEVSGGSFWVLAPQLRSELAVAWGPRTEPSRGFPDRFGHKCIHLLYQSSCEFLKRESLVSPFPLVNPDRHPTQRFLFGTVATTHRSFDHEKPVHETRYAN